jgi:hypothetical protein
MYKTITHFFTSFLTLFRGLFHTKSTQSAFTANEIVTIKTIISAKEPQQSTVEAKSATPALTPAEEKKLMAGMPKGSEQLPIAYLQNLRERIGFEPWQLVGGLKAIAETFNDQRKHNKLSEVGTYHAYLHISGRLSFEDDKRVTGHPAVLCKKIMEATGAGNISQVREFLTWVVMSAWTWKSMIPGFVQSDKNEKNGHYILLSRIPPHPVMRNAA